jgi:hypothetical protein
MPAKGDRPVAIDHQMTLDDDLLVVTASGFDEDVSDVEGYGTAVIGAAIRGEVTRILSDERALEYRLGTTDTFRAAEFLAASAPAVGRVALVCSEQGLPDARFWEDVTVNRGLQARLFTDVDEARAWLAVKASPTT